MPEKTVFQERIAEENAHIMCQLRKVKGKRVKDKSFTLKSLCPRYIHKLR